MDDHASAKVLSSPKLRVVQCWDDGNLDDLQLCDILRRHGAKASFNLMASNHQAERIPAWKFQGWYQVYRLTWQELRSVYEGFTIANHSLTHPHATQISLDNWRYEVEENRKRLQDHFGQPIDGFAYPYGEHDAATMEVVREAGHVYARTCENATPCFPVSDVMAQPTDCHFLAADFWDRYERAKTTGNVFYFWGHSYEITNKKMWADFEAQIARITADPDVQWADLPSLFTRS
jgi:peptidoglycan/xylan/chitin deacetylase (PgdA/CDA1 family)